MVLRFLMLLVFFIFACSDHERDNVYDIEGKDSLYKMCDSQKFNSVEQRCENNVIETKCGDGWFNADNVNLRCENDVIEGKCGSGWFNASNANLRCQSNVIETACGSGWFNASNANLRCQSNVIQATCGSGWYNASDENFRCQSGVIETLCKGSLYNSWYNASNANLRCQSGLVETACGTGWYNASNENLKCQDNAIMEKCGDKWFAQAGGNKRCFFNTIKTKCGSAWYDSLDVNFKCENSILQERCGSSWFNVATDFCSVGGEATRYNMLIDARDKKSYKTVVIGTQTWMAENLNYELIGTVTVGECYDKIKANCDIYGRLYSWDEAEAVCPVGWRLPGESDWASLTANIGTDDSDFAPLPGGIGFSGYFLNIDQAGFWWSATPGAAGFAYGQSVFFENGGYSFYSSFFNKSSLLSVRCIMEVIP